MFSKACKFGRKHKFVCEKFIFHSIPSIIVNLSAKTGNTALRHSKARRLHNTDYRSYWQCTVSGTARSRRNKAVHRYTAAACTTNRHFQIDIPGYCTHGSPVQGLPPSLRVLTLPPGFPALHGQERYSNTTLHYGNFLPCRLTPYGLPYNTCYAHNSLLP